MTGFIEKVFEMLNDWPIGTLLGVLIIVITLLLLALLANGCFIAFDSWFLTRERSAGRVIDKTFTPAHTEYILIYNAATKTSMPQPIFHPDDWSVNVEVNGNQDSISIEEKDFKILNKGDEVMAEYVMGRISGNLYLKEIFH